jgi:RimJ/RimL family protein N-acetyltransferase
MLSSLISSGKGQGLRLRPFELADAQAVAEAVRESFAEIHAWMAWCHVGYSVEDARSWLRLQAHEFERGLGFHFAVLSADARLLGCVGLNQVDPANRRANLGYWIRTSAAGRGVATSAVETVRDWAFANTNLIRLEIVIAIGNRASYRVAEHLGAQYEGVMRRRLMLHGRAHDATLFSITREPPVH